MPGRHITDSIRSVHDLLHYADQNNLDGYFSTLKANREKSNYLWYRFLEIDKAGHSVDVNR